MAEVGLDAMRHGEEGQARSLEWQIGAAFSAGCSGVFVFSWTDEWYRGGADVKDWKFGLTSEHRGPKPALAAVRAQFSDSPFAEHTTWPRISVIVCSYNGSATIRETCEGLSRLDYPNHEVIVVNDGSTDRTAEIVAEYPFQLISTGNRGLSSARNMGMEAASGEIVAYIDDDAYPDRDWLRYLALAFLRGKYVGVGGPNLPPPGDGEIAECVANAPGGPMHVLLTDREAEHVPGCNMAFRKDALVAIGGFDPIYRVAGDDVDICWRLQELDGVIGFAPTAVVWHHRRNSVAMFLKQQRGYGKAEALLELKWPRRHNVFGHASWAGRMYGNGAAVKLGRGRIYQGTWGTAPFQLLYRSSNSALLSLFSMPEWHLVIAGLLFLSALSWIWRPLAFCIPLLIVALALPLAQAAIGASRAKYSTPARGMRHRLRRFALTAFLHLVQPFARLLGRMQHGLTPWRSRNVKTSTKLFRGVLSLWREHWEEPAKSLRELSERLEARGAVVAVGGDYDHWDLEVRVGTFGGARIIMATEEHGEGRQMLRFRVSPFVGRFPIVLISVCCALAMAAAFDSAWVITGMFAVFIVLIGCVAVIHVARASALVRSALRGFGAR